MPTETILFDSWSAGFQGLSIQVSFAVGLLFLRKVSVNFALGLSGLFFALNLGMLPFSLSEYLGSGPQSLEQVRATIQAKGLSSDVYRAHLFNVFCMTLSPSLIFGLTSLAIYKSKKAALTDMTR